MQSGFDKDIVHSPGGVSDGRVKVNADDVAGYLSSKLLQGSNIILTVGQNGIIINAEVQTAVQTALNDYQGGHEIQTDGTPVNQREVLDFIGANVKVTDDAVNGKTLVEIDPSDGHVIFVQTDNAVPQRAGLKFVGGRVVYSDDPTGDKTVITIEGGYVIQSEGIALPYQPNLNFIGDAVTVTDDALTTTTTVEINKHIIQEEGGNLPTRTHINFVGGGIVATDDLENDRTIVTLSDGVAGGHVIQDDGVLLAERTNLNFVGAGVEVTDDPTNNATVVNVTGGGEGGSGSGLTVTPVSAPTVAAVNLMHYVCDGTTTINLPAGVSGYVIGVSDGNNTFANAPLTINANGTNRIGNSTQASLTLDRNGSCVVLGFANGIWAYLSAESFNDTGVGTGEIASVRVSDGNKGDVTVSGDGGTWTLNTSGVTPASYLNPSLTVDSKGRVTAASSKTTITTVAPTVTDDSSSGYTVSHKWLNTVEQKEYTLVDDTVGAAVWKQVGGGADVIELSADTTWYVAPDGDPEADGLTVGTPITLEEAASRVFRVVPTDTNFTITIELANGIYNYANNYTFRYPDVEFDFAIKLHGADWVGLSSFPTVTIMSLLSFEGFEDYSYIENLTTVSMAINNSQFDISNVASYFRLTIRNNSYVYVCGTYKFSENFNSEYPFNVNDKGYLDLDAEFNITNSYTCGGFVLLENGASLMLNNVLPTVGVGVISGTKIKYITNDVFLFNYGAGTLAEKIGALPGSITSPYPNYLVEPSNTLATTASLATVATSGSYNDLSNKPILATPPATATDTGVAGQIAYDATNIYVCVATNTWVKATLATW